MFGKKKTQKKEAIDLVAEAVDGYINSAISQLRGGYNMFAGPDTHAAVRREITLPANITTAKEAYEYGAFLYLKSGKTPPGLWKEL
jgi:hypothetical protein